MSSGAGEGQRAAEAMVTMATLGFDPRKVDLNSIIVHWKQVIRTTTCRNVELFRGGLVFKAHRLLYHSTLGSRVMKKKMKETGICVMDRAAVGWIGRQVGG